MNIPKPVEQVIPEMDMDKTNLLTWKKLFEDIDSGIVVNIGEEPYYLKLDKFGLQTSRLSDIVEKVYMVVRVPIHAIHETYFFIERNQSFTQSSVRPLEDPEWLDEINRLTSWEESYKEIIETINSLRNNVPPPPKTA